MIDDWKCITDTEIDWIAYMQEVEGFLNGEMDYMNLKGIFALYMDMDMDMDMDEYNLCHHICSTTH